MNETTIEWVLEHYPERVKALFEALDLDRAGLETVKAAVGRGDTAGACRALLDYYRIGQSGQWLREREVQPGGRGGEADLLLSDIYTDMGRQYCIPRTPQGRIAWGAQAIDSDEGWLWNFNRHEHLPTVLLSYQKTGAARYVQWLDEHIRDWVIGSLPYPAQDTIDARWRGLETALRISCGWSVIFYKLQHDPHFSDATRLLMLSSLPEHAHYLRHFHKGGGNWITTELAALGLIAVAWPEFREATAWQTYCGETLLRSMPGQIYPDGVQGELTSMYHGAALWAYEQYADLCRDVGIALPEGYRDWLEKMWNYLAYVMLPDGYYPQNNDSDHGSCRDGVIKAAEAYGRPDWLYIATNGAHGEQPKQGPSLIFPWAGQVIARSGWDADALWAFFDIGPQGFGHSHCDKLHLSVHAHGRDLLIDPGRFTYAFESADGRFQGKYAGLAVAHNVILIDDRGQAAGPGWVDKPVPEEDYRITPELTFARGTCEEFFEEIYSGRLAGRAAHTRAVLVLGGDMDRTAARNSSFVASVVGSFVDKARDKAHDKDLIRQISGRDDLIIVADRIETDRPRKLDALWHWHPRCTVAIEGQDVRTVDPDVGNMRITPVAGFDWTVETVKGQEPAGIHGTMQGWYAHGYQNWEPSPASVYTARIEQTTAFAWLLLPTRGEAPAIRGEIVENTDEAIAIRIYRPDAPELTVRLPWRGGYGEKNT